MTSLLQQQQADVFLSQAGQKGGIVLTDTNAETGNWRMIQCLTNTVFATLTSNFTTNGTSTATVGSDYGTVPAGTILYGKFTAVDLTSGLVILYV